MRAVAGTSTFLSTSIVHRREAMGHGPALAIENCEHTVACPPGGLDKIIETPSLALDPQAAARMAFCWSPIKLQNQLQRELCF